MTDALVRETLPPRPRAIVRATDLGAVRVLKHGSLFALCDPFGDMRPDSRGLGLYDGDTRVLSCAVLRVDGQRPVVLRSDDGGSWRAVVELTNGDLREPPQTRASVEARPSRESIGITRERWLAGASFHERISVANFALVPYEVTVELELDADFADIFEVRGVHREDRGELLGIELHAERVVFGYRGIAGVETRTVVEFSEPPAIHAVGDEADGRLVAEWTWPLSGGARRRLEWSAAATIPSTPPSSICSGGA